MLEPIHFVVERWSGYWVAWLSDARIIGLGGETDHFEAAIRLAESRGLPTQALRELLEVARTDHREFVIIPSQHAEADAKLD